jgi:hypothetical protein
VPIINLCSEFCINIEVFDISAFNFLDCMYMWINQSFFIFDSDYMEKILIMLAVYD